MPLLTDGTSTMRLTIGIPVRNEEKNIASFVQGLLRAIRKLPDALVSEVLFCLNGSTDGTEQLLREQIRGFAEPGVPVRVLTSAEGKLRAQCAIASDRVSQGPLCFLDADTELDENCLLALWKTFSSDDAIEVAYAKVTPTFRQPLSVVERLQKMHYDVRDVVYTRRYFHGRAYIIRDWSYPDFRDLDWPDAQQLDVIRRYAHTTMELDRGPHIDDVYISRYLVHQFGPGCIREVSEAIVYFAPPASLRDFYSGHRRLWIEVARLNLLFVEHQHVQREHFRRRRRQIKLRTLPIDQQVKHAAYFTIELLAKSLAYVEIKLALWGLHNLQPIWPTVETTKSLIGKSAGQARSNE